jgi:hypothetical protein
MNFQGKSYAGKRQVVSRYILSNLWKLLDNFMSVFISSFPPKCFKYTSMFSKFHKIKIQEQNR